MISAAVIPVALAYAASSACLLVANKWALSHLPKPDVVMVAQFLFSAVAVWLLGVVGVVAVDKFDMSKMRKFFFVVFCFYLALWSNMNTMKHLSVDMIILFRTCTPFAVAFGDFLILGRHLPSSQAWFSLGCIALCTFFVFVREPSVSVVGLVWGCAYYIILCFDQLYLKKFAADVKLTTHARVLYTNALSAVVAFVVGAMTGEWSGILYGEATEHSDGTGLSLLTSCVLGLGISYSAWALRSRISALTFTLIGVMCKILSIALNWYFLDHLSVRSMVLISLGIVASTFYEEPKARAGQRDVNLSDSSGEKRKTDDDFTFQKPKPMIAPSGVTSKQAAAATLFVIILFIGLFTGESAEELAKP